MANGRAPGYLAKVRVYSRGGGQQPALLPGLCTPSNVADHVSTSEPLVDFRDEWYGNGKVAICVAGHEGGANNPLYVAEA